MTEEHKPLDEKRKTSNSYDDEEKDIISLDDLEDGIYLEKDVKESIKRVMEEEPLVTPMSWHDLPKTHLLYPYRHSKSEMKSKVKEIYNFLIMRWQDKLTKEFGKGLVENGK